jgi:(p)ppGpp synthase/HD superfamily hydrolase
MPLRASRFLYSGAGMEPTLSLYNQSMYSREELIDDVAPKLHPAGLTMVLGACDMAASVHEYQLRNDATPWYWHITRVVRILIRELEYYNPDAIAAAFLHDVMEDSDLITPEVLTYNFGPYVCYVVEVLTKRRRLLGVTREEDEHEYLQRLRESSIDCKIIKFAERLENFRCLEYGVRRNPFQYIEETETLYFPIAERENNTMINQLVESIKAVRGKMTT